MAKRGSTGVSTSSGREETKQNETQSPPTQAGASPSVVHLHMSCLVTKGSEFPGRLPSQDLPGHPCLAPLTSHMS